MLEESLIGKIFSASGISTLLMFLVVVLVVYGITKLTNMTLSGALHTSGSFIVKKFSAMIGKKERNYHRDLEIGKIDEKRRKVKAYRFFSELIVDLGMGATGIRPYEFMYFICIGCAMLSVVIAQTMFTSIFTAILIFPIVVAGIVCVLYTKANVAHDRRIEDVMDAENIICNNIRNGVTVAIRDNLQVIPESLRPYFQDYLDNVQYKSYHIKTALMELNGKLGSVADEFIKKCIILETEESEGVMNTFEDIVEVNNIKKSKRLELKKELEKKVTDTKISAVLIFLFLFAVIFLYSFVRSLYFKTIIGNIILLIDMLLMIIIYVICTVVRATEL